MFVEQRGTVPRFVHNDNRDNEVLELIAHNGPMSGAVDNAIWLLQTYIQADLHEVIANQDTMRRIVHFLCQRQNELDTDDIQELLIIERKLLQAESSTPIPFQQQQIHSIVERVDHLIRGNGCIPTVLDEDGEPYEQPTVKRTPRSWLKK